MPAANASSPPWAVWVCVQTQPILQAYPITTTPLLAQYKQLGPTTAINGNAKWICNTTGSSLLMKPLITHLTTMITQPRIQLPTHCPVYMLLALWHLTHYINSPGFRFITSFHLGYESSWLFFSSSSFTLLLSQLRTTITNGNNMKCHHLPSLTLFLIPLLATLHPNSSGFPAITCYSTSHGSSTPYSFSFYHVFSTYHLRILWQHNILTPLTPLPTNHNCSSL